jgi:uncharacterized Zn finger protein
LSAGDRWDGWQRLPKRPPPEHGIRVEKTGATWWGQRWIAALESISANYAGRLARGRTYARQGRTHDLVVEAGEVTARVTGSRPTPYEIRMTLAALDDASWDKAIAAMAKKAHFAAELLAGQMPREIDQAFRESGASLFPMKSADLATLCSCPDLVRPCKHVAATHYVLGEALDRDPFLLFELRGRTKEQVLEALRAARTGDEHGGAERGTSALDAEIPSVVLGEISPADYDKPREPLPALHLGFEAPSIPGVLLKQLGAPVGWSKDAPPAEVLGPLVRAASEKARRIALAEPDGDAFEEKSVEGAHAFPASRKTPAT